MLVSSPEPLNCLYVFKFQSVPALLRGSFNKPEGKGLKGVWGEGQAMSSLLSFTACKAPSKSTLYAVGDSLPSALGDSMFFLPKGSKETAKGNPMNYTVTRCWQKWMCPSQATGQVVNPLELQVCPSCCPFQWFWASHLTKQTALNWLPTCYREHITAVTQKVTVTYKYCGWQSAAVWNYEAISTKRGFQREGFFAWDGR